MESISSSRFETIYEFVDTNPMPDDRVPHQNITEEDSATTRHDDESTNVHECTKRTGDLVERLKNFKCSICVKKFRKL